MEENLIMIDPPEGWKYGFPKAVTKEQYLQIKNLTAWCIAMGYPKNVAEEYGKHFHIRVSGNF